MKVYHLNTVSFTIMDQTKDGRYPLDQHLHKSDYGANCPQSSHVHPASATHVPRKRQDFQNTVAVKLESEIAMSPTLPRQPGQHRTQRNKRRERGIKTSPWYVSI